MDRIQLEQGTVRDPHRMCVSLETSSFLSINYQFELDGLFPFQWYYVKKEISHLCVNVQKSRSVIQLFFFLKKVPPLTSVK